MFDRRTASVLALGSIAVACGPTQGSPDGGDETGGAAEHGDDGHATGDDGDGSTGGSGSGGGDVESGSHSPEELLCEDCWYDSAQAGVCVAEWDACAASLACEQLQQCLHTCGAECFAECNAIIPSGVEPLRALVQCMACADAPCASECEGSIMLSYCG